MLNDARLLFPGLCEWDAMNKFGIALDVCARYAIVCTALVAWSGMLFWHTYGCNCLHTLQAISLNHVELFGQLQKKKSAR